jgi:type I restriction enzyme M protein
VQSERFIDEHKGRLGDISVYGQESNPTTWRLAAMNMAIRGIDFNFGGEPANTFSNDKHPDLRADFVMANPPFNMKEWNTGIKDDDPRWQYGTPPAGNANFAWMQHMLYHLAPNGCMALLLANGSMSSNTNNEGEIRKRLLEEDRVECMVSLPGQLFTNTQIPACIWFLTKNKKAHNGFRDRTNQVLFIDARNLGYMKDRVLRDFTASDIRKIADTFQQWRTVGWAEPSEAQQLPNGGGNVGLPNVSPTYQDIRAFCKSATLDEIRQHDYVITPGRYVGAAEQEDDGEPFAEKMARLTAQLKEQFEQSDKLEAKIKKNLAGLGYEF